MLILNQTMLELDVDHGPFRFRENVPRWKNTKKRFEPGDGKDRRQAWGSLRQSPSALLGIEWVATLV